MVAISVRSTCSYFLLRWESPYRFVEHVGKRGKALAQFVASELRRPYYPDSAKQLQNSIERSGDMAWTEFGELVEGLSPLIEFVNSIADPSRKHPLASRLFGMFSKMVEDLGKMSQNRFAMHAQRAMGEVWQLWEGRALFESLRCVDPRMVVAGVVPRDAAAHLSALRELMPAELHKSFGEYLQAPPSGWEGEGVVEFWDAEADKGGDRGKFAQRVKFLMYTPCTVTDVDSTLSVCGSVFDCRQASLLPATISMRATLVANRNMRGKGM